MNHSWSVLLESILAVLHLTSSVSYGEDCLNIIVGLRTDYETPPGKNLEIDCTYSYINCTNQSACNVSWYKLQRDIYVPVTFDSHINMRLIKLSNVETKLLLCFTNIQKSNAGFYRCQNGLTVGHRIQVSVYDSNMTRKETSEIGMPEEGQWMYLYSAAGTMAFVIIVIFISVISLQRCKGHARRETQTETQHLSSVNQQTGVKPQDLPTSSSSYIYSKISTEEEKRPATRTEKDASSVTYAALNHQLPPDAPVRPRRPKEESSEYADIRG